MRTSENTTTAAQSPASTPGTLFQPVASGERISSVDTLRGVALLGILLINITGFALPYASDNPTIYGGAQGPDLFVWAVNNVLVEGTMRGIFCMLFGAGIILYSRRLEYRGISADVYYRRTMWLILFGVVHAYLLLYPGDILYGYGIVGLFLYSFRNIAPRRLFIIGPALLAVPLSLNIFGYQEAKVLQAEAPALKALVDQGEELDPEQQDMLDEWDEFVEEWAHPSDEELSEAIRQMNSSYAGAFTRLAPVVAYYQSYELYLDTFWDVGGMMLLGMALMKLGVFTGSRSYRFYLTMMVLGYGIGLPVNLYNTRALVDSNFDPLVFHKTWITYDLGRVPTTFGHIGLLLIFCKSGWPGWLQDALAAVGRTALSNYILHTAICIFIFTGAGLALFGALRRHELYYVVAGIYLVNLTASPLWLRFYRFGPLEWVWRSLTHGQMQPMRKSV